MAITFRPITAPDDDALMRLHELNPGYTVERLADGALLVSPNGAAGGMRNVELSFQLRSWDRRTHYGPTFDSSTGFRLPDSSVFSPDGAFVCAARWQPLTQDQRERYFDGAPDAAFEIVSRTDLRSEQLMKCEAYARSGSALVVLLDPYRQTVDRWLDGVHESLGKISSLDCGPVMPEFILDVDAILDA
jgi:Uma2 family endonuclease